MRTKASGTQTLIYHSGFSALLILILLAGGMNTSWAQVPTYGNLYQQEYGDAVYRELDFFLDYNHTAVFAGMNSSDGMRVMEAVGEVLSSGVDTTAEVDFVDFNGLGQNYYGAYTKNNQTLSASARRSIVSTAVSLVNANIPYVVFDAINFNAGGTGVSYIYEIRCDAFIEYCYEANGYVVWWPSANSNHWSILSYPGDHNNAPTPPSNPGSEFSPWAQRGAPGYSPNPGNTYLTQPSVINLPTYQVTQVAGNGYVDVTIRATDESGIHFIGYKKPGDTAWSYSPTQPQHPTSDSYTFGPIRITSSGTLYVSAMDNGGNWNSINPPGYAITITGASNPNVRTDPVSDKTTTSATLNATITGTGGSSIVDARFEWTSTTFPGTVIYGVPVSGNTFSYNLTGLQPNTTYTYHSYAKNSAGYWNSSVNNVVFTTDNSIQTVATPVISPNGGSFASSVQVTLACSTPSATIRYTTNGSDPTGSSSLYSEAFTLTASAMVKAKAFRSGYADSGIASASFTISSSGNPAIEVTGGGEIIPSGTTATSQFNNTDFGDRWIGEETVLYNFRIYNQGLGNLNLTGNPKIQIDGSSSFSIETSPISPVVPGDYTFFKIYFNPQSVGIHTATVRINSNDPTIPEYTYAIRGEGKLRDLTPPTVTITSPTSSPTWNTSSPLVNLEGQASDNVAVTQVTWSNDRGGAGAATGTTTWSANGISLLSGVNVITVAARDATNNVGTDSITITYTPPIPEITVSVANLTQSVQQGTNATSQTFTVRNTGSGTLNYVITTNAGWLSVNPANATSTGEEDMISVSYATTNLSVGVHSATITVSAAGAINTPVAIPVNMVVTLLPSNVPYEAKSAVPMSTFQVAASAMAPDGGVLLVSYFTGTVVAGGQSLTANGNLADIYAVKLNTNGQVAWVKQYGGTNEEQIASCVSHPAGGWVISGHFKNTANLGPHSLVSAGNRDAFLARLDENGNVLWARRGGGSKVDYGNRAAVDGFGNCFLAGEFTTSATFSGGATTLTAAGTRFDIFLAKYNSNGDFQWAKSAGGAAYDTVECAVVDAMGNIYVGGIFETQAMFGSYTLTVQGNPMTWDAYLAKFNSNGDVTWAKRFGEPSGGLSTDYLNFISVSTNGSCFFGGSYDGPMFADGLNLPAQSDQAVFVGKINNAGSLEWLRDIPTTTVPEIGFYTSRAFASQGLVTKDGGLIVGGSYNGRITFGSTSVTNASSPSNSTDNLFFAKFDASGAPQWLIPADSLGSSDLHYLGAAAGDNVRFMALFTQEVDMSGIGPIAVISGDTLLVELGPPETTPPTISSSIGEGKIILTWPISATGFVLEWATNLSPANWTSHSTAPTVVGGNFTVTNSISGGTRFFRLKK